MLEPHEEPSSIAAEQGHVVVDGPGAIAFAMSPDAAIETAERLHQSAAMAQGQRVMRGRKGNL